MAQSSSYAVLARRRCDAPRPAPAVYQLEDFPGCESFHLPASEVDHYEGRLEFWDGHTETAWKVCDPTSIYHEQPCRRLARMAERVAALRGSSIECFGSADLVRLDAAGRKRWLMQADEVLYLHPDRSRLRGPSIDVDEDPLPEVVLEVDHTTDVRRRKLEIYKESSFPEIWVLVPWESSVRAPGLTIHVRRGDVYREEAASRAFPAWKAEEIHRALTENPLSEPTWRALERTALAMGAREGTRPEDDPITRSVSEKAEVKGYARGHKEGHDEGRNEGRNEGRDEGRREILAANVLAVLKARGIEAAPDFTEDRDLFSGLSGDALMAAAMACTDETDFRRRVREQLGLHTEPPP